MCELGCIHTRQSRARRRKFLAMASRNPICGQRRRARAAIDSVDRFRRGACHEPFMSPLIVASALLVVSATLLPLIFSFLGLRKKL
jgi:hypothetical protein